MNAKTCKRIRQAASLRGSGPAQYAAPEIHHLAEAPVYKQHTRTIRSWDPKQREIISRIVEKIIYGRDGKTPRYPEMKEIEHEGKKVTVHQTMMLSITKPIRLKPGTAKAIYRLLKKLERTVGLDAVYAQLAQEAQA